jgi:hypothetical protein
MVLVAGAALILLTLTACGGSDSVTATAAATEPAATPAASASDARSGFAAYRDCMTTNGVDLGDQFGGGTPPSGAPAGGPPSGMPTGAPPSGAVNGPGSFPLPSGVDQQAFDKAQQACASLRPQFGDGGPRGGAAIDATALAAFTSCLSDHGVTVPSGTDVMRGLDRTDPAVKAAMDVCAPLLPAPTPSS